MGIKSPRKVLTENMNNVQKDEYVVPEKKEKLDVFDPQLEPLLRDNPRRFVIFPIQYQDIWKMYKKVLTLNSSIIFILIHSNNMQ